MSALINDTYLQQFLKVQERMNPASGTPWDRSSRGPVRFTREKLMVCAQCPDRWPVTSESNTIRTQFPNLISAMSHNKLPHSEKWEWMAVWGRWELEGKDGIKNKVAMMGCSVLVPEREG